jgi:AcrR family transcriptional regulator
MPDTGLLARLDATDDGEWEFDMYTKMDILTVACALFCERGYRGTTIREIARALDVKEGSLYSHMKSKEEILWEIVHRLANLFLAQASFVAQDLPYGTQLALLIRGHLDVITHEFQGATVFFREWHLLAPDLREQIQVKRFAYEAYFHRVLCAGKQQGIFHFSDVHTALFFILSSLNSTYQCEPLMLARMKEQYEEFILHALKPQ